VQHYHRGGDRQQNQFVLARIRNTKSIIHGRKLRGRILALTPTAGDDEIEWRPSLARPRDVAAKEKGSTEEISGAALDFSISSYTLNLLLGR
jgi:hypothetical protein